MVPVDRNSVVARWRSPAPWRRQMQPVLHPIKNFCAAYGVGKTKAYELIASGELQTVKIGRKRLITDASARRALLGQVA